MRLKYIPFLTFILFIGCAIKLPSEMPTPELPEITLGMLDSTSTYRSYLNIADVEDARIDNAFLRYLDQTIEGSTEVGPVIKKRIEHIFTEHGFVISEEAAPLTLSVEVEKWETVLSGKFQKNLDAEALLAVEVIDPDNRTIYAGRYKGYAHMKQRDIDIKDIEKMLVASMREAVKQVALDRKLVRKLTSI